MPTLNTKPGQRPKRMYTSNDRLAKSLPISGQSGVAQPWIMRFVIEDPVKAGDILSVDARARITNNAGYNVGVGYWLEAFIVNQSATGPWWDVSELNGDNVDPLRHHMPIQSFGDWEVPDTWVYGNKVAIVFKGDAHSTDWEAGDTITVDDGYEGMRVTRWTDEP